MHSASAAPEPAGQGSYGIRVEVDPRILEERSLGIFDTLDQDGKLSVVRVYEERHDTSSEGVGAVSYRLESEDAGELSPKTIWSFISALSSALIAMVLIYSLMVPDLDLGLPHWAYYSMLIPIFLVSKSLELRKFRRFAELIVSAQTLGRLKELYGAAALIDLPGGQLQRARDDFKLSLSALPNSRLRSSVGPSSGASAVDGPQSEQKGSLHGQPS